MRKVFAAACVLVVLLAVPAAATRDEVRERSLWLLPWSTRTSFSEMKGAGERRRRSALVEGMAGTPSRCRAGTTC